jgi:hypothetical protein
MGVDRQLAVMSCSSLVESLLCAPGAVRALVNLALAVEHRRGHGALHDGINDAGPRPGLAEALRPSATDHPRSTIRRHFEQIPLRCDGGLSGPAGTR